MDDDLHPGDPVTYLQVSPGGYGFASRVPAIVIRHTRHRVVIRVTLRDGTTTKDIAVSPNYLQRRDEHEARRGRP